MHANHYFDTFIQAEIQRLEKTKPHHIGDNAAWTGPRKRGTSQSPASDEIRRITAEQRRILQAHTAYPVLVAIREGVAQRNPRWTKERAREQFAEIASNPVYHPELSKHLQSIKRILDLTTGPNDLHYSDFRIKLRQCVNEIETALRAGADALMSEAA
jgi:hypothetical protein